MNQLRILSLTTLLLMLASRLPGQTPAQGENWDARVVACNDGRITFSVARAYRDVGLFTGYRWRVAGWYNVDPGKCEWIGGAESYHNGGIKKDSVMLLAFVFTDSTGTWGAIKIQGGPKRSWSPSNQQFCVKHDGFGYTRDGPGGDLPRACDGAQAGYQMIPASFEYGGPLGLARLGYDANNELHVELDSSDRAIPLGPQISSGGATQNPENREGFKTVLKSVLNTLPDSEETLGPDGRVQLKPGYRFVFPCAEPSVIYEESLANLQTVRARALAQALRNFISSHREGTLRFLVTERGGAFFVRQTYGKTGDCLDAGNVEFSYQSRDVGVSPTSPGTTTGVSGNLPPPPPRPGNGLPPPPPPPSATRIPPRPRVAPIMVGKVDVSQLAGLLWGDTREYVSYILGPPTSDPEQDSSGFGGYPYRRDDGLSIRVNYDNNVVTSVKVYSGGSRGTDPLLALLGKSESAAVALLGPPGTRESLWDIDNTDLVWSFPAAGRPADQRPNPQTIQTLTLHFRTGVGCESISVIW